MELGSRDARSLSSEAGEGIGTKTRANRVELRCKQPPRPGLAAFKQNALKALGPVHPVTTVTAVVPLSEATFGL